PTPSWLTSPTAIGIAPANDEPNGAITRLSTCEAASNTRIRPAEETTARGPAGITLGGTGCSACATPGGVHGRNAPWQLPPVEAIQSCTVIALCFGVWST